MTRFLAPLCLLTGIALGAVGQAQVSRWIERRRESVLDLLEEDEAWPRPFRRRRRRWTLTRVAQAMLLGTLGTFLLLTTSTVLLCTWFAVQTVASAPPAPPGNGAAR